MKKLMSVFSVLCLVFSMATADDAPRGWLTSLEEAEAKAEQQNLPILILVSGPEWCGPCKMLHKTVITDKDFNKTLQKHAVFLYLHQPRKTDPDSQTAKDIRECSSRKYFTSGGVPRYIIVSPDKKVLGTPKRRTVMDFAQAIADAQKKMGLEENADLQSFIEKVSKDQKKLDKKLEKLKSKKKKDKKADKKKEKKKSRKKDKDKDKDKD